MENPDKPYRVVQAYEQHHGISGPGELTPCNTCGLEQTQLVLYDEKIENKKKPRKNNRPRGMCTFCWDSPLRRKLYERVRSLDAG